MGWIKRSTGDYALGLLFLGLGLAISGLIALSVRRVVANERPRDSAAGVGSAGYPAS
jgi:hypothetical protein